ncbi:MAG TPA: class I SAM-dependent methyltransferase [Ktedonobacterales bacterium]|jgi:ubiquinone/menaquinone biosynthesis C-methylase UbiE
MAEHPDDAPILTPEVVAHYASGYEEQRLTARSDQIEMHRTQELLARYLPPAPAVILDVGGGPGVHALWLARRGYTVHLVDALPLHVDLARAASARQSDAPLASVALGDARHLDRADASADAVLLLGPLYHLTARDDRLAALGEARRVVRPGGVVLAVGISRYATTLDMLFRGLLADPAAAAIAEQDRRDGQHRNPTNHPELFTTVFLHHPDDLRAEVAAAGLRCNALLGIEGPAWLSSWAREHWGDAATHERLMDMLRAIEAEPTLLGVSAHLMAVARKPDTDAATR